MQYEPLRAWTHQGTHQGQIRPDKSAGRQVLKGRPKGRITRYSSV
jgi:hypothetical protein